MIHINNKTEKYFSGKIQNILPKTKTELSRVAAEIPDLPDGRAAALDQVEVDSK